MRSRPSAVSSKVYDKGDDMRYIQFSRGPGSAFEFRMTTPQSLRGKHNPITNRPFGNTIIKGLGTRNLREARRKRDVLLGDIRRMEQQSIENNLFSADGAEAWRDDIKAYDRAGYDPKHPSSPVDPREVLADAIERELELPTARRTVSDAQLRRASAIAHRRADLQTLLEPYLAHRAPGNSRGLAPFALGTARDIRTTVGHLLDFMEGTIILDDLTRADAMQFRNEYLPALRSHRAPSGPSAKTINKHLTLLSGIWDWAIGEGHLREDHQNPWRGFPRRARLQQNERTLFSPQDVTKLLARLPHGDRLGDICRLALVTGCRANEMAALAISSVEDDHSGFTVDAGKTANAKRFVPVPECLRGAFLARVEGIARDGRVFPEWPVRPSSGKCGALPAAFTRYRRKVLGDASDGTLVFHSFRHTWRTMARRARIAEANVDQLGGWAGPERSSSPYDHGLSRDELGEVQEEIAARLNAEGYLEAL